MTTRSHITRGGQGGIGVWLSIHPLTLMLAFALGALVLAALGIYGIVTNAVLRRTHEIAGMQQKIEEQRVDLEKLSPNDTLTGLLNRRALMDRLIEEVVRSQRYGLPLSLMLLDVDRLDNINQLYSRHMGDVVLSSVAQQIQTSVRTTDVAGRYGDDEFCIIMPETILEGSESTWERKSGADLELSSLKY